MTVRVIFLCLSFQVSGHLQVCELILVTLSIVVCWRVSSCSVHERICWKTLKKETMWNPGAKYEDKMRWFCKEIICEFMTSIETARLLWKLTDWVTRSLTDALMNHLSEQVRQFSEFYGNRSLWTSSQQHAAWPNSEQTSSNTFLRTLFLWNAL
jgi:hypothetical protein